MKLFGRVKLKFATNAIVQFLMVIFQALNWQITDDEIKPIVLGTLTLIQAVVAFAAHHSNPDATDVRTAYRAK